MKKNLIFTLAVFFLMTLNILVSPFESEARNIERVSLDNSGVEGDDDSWLCNISSDGSYVSFQSDATNLVSGDTNGIQDVFVYDRETDEIERVSVSTGGEQGNGPSRNPSMSSDNRYVAFDSWASNLVAVDTNGRDDVFVYDRNTDVLEMVSVNSAGVQGNSNSFAPSISSDGRYVAFHSAADNLVAEDGNTSYDIFVYDRNADTIEIVSVNSSGDEGNMWSNHASISSDGRYVAFDSIATNLVPNDTNGRIDVFVYDRNTDTIERISINNIGVQGDLESEYPSISSDGRYVAFQSGATNLVSNDSNDRRDVFVYDRDTDTIERVSVDNAGVQGDDGSSFPSINSDGRYVAFQSVATNLVTGDTNAYRDVFVYDRDTDTIERVSVDNSGDEGDFRSRYPSISSDGKYIAFDSQATNLVTGDTNVCPDVFVSYTVQETPPGGGGSGSGGCFIGTALCR